jgi:hypothetical protein
MPFDSEEADYMKSWMPFLVSKAPKIPGEECPVCYETYDSKSRAKLCLRGCSHCLCSVCYEQLTVQVRNAGRSSRCPLCRGIIEEAFSGPEVGNLGRALPTPEILTPDTLASLPSPPPYKANPEAVSVLPPGALLGNRKTFRLDHLTYHPGQENRVGTTTGLTIHRYGYYQKLENKTTLSIEQYGAPFGGQLGPKVTETIIRREVSRTRTMQDDTFQAANCTETEFAKGNNRVENLMSTLTRKHFDNGEFGTKTVHEPELHFTSACRLRIFRDDSRVGCAKFYHAEGRIQTTIQQSLDVVIEGESKIGRSREAVIRTTVVREAFTKPGLSDPIKSSPSTSDKDWKLKMLVFIDIQSIIARCRPELHNWKDLENFLQKGTFCADCTSLSRSPRYDTVIDSTSLSLLVRVFHGLAKMLPRLKPVRITNHASPLLKTLEVMKAVNP